MIENELDGIYQYVFTSMWIFGGYFTDISSPVCGYLEDILAVCLHQYVEMPIVPRPDCQEDYSEVKTSYHNNISVEKTFDKTEKN